MLFPQSSLSPSKDLPGFRKILPRASYFLLSKGCSPNHQPGASQSEVTVESVDPPVEGGLPSVSLAQEPQFTPLGLAGEVELTEQPVVVDDIAEEMAVVPHLTYPQGIPPSSSSSASFKALAATDVHVSQGSADLMAGGVTLKGNETRTAGGGYVGPTVQQIQGEATQVVAIIPTQVRNVLLPVSRMSFIYVILVKIIRALQVKKTMSVIILIAKKCFNLSLTSEPAGAQAFGRCQHYGPSDDGLCRSQHWTECQTFI